MNQTIRIQVNDMHCQSCPKLIQMNLEDLAGVKSVSASLATKLVEVEYDDSKTSQEDLLQTIKDSGYNPIVLKNYA